MEIDYAAIGVRIRRLRKEKKLTQEKLAELAHQEPSNISHIERGATKLSLPTLISIANALKVTANDLLCDSMIQDSFSFEKIVSELLQDCSLQEKVIITETMRELKMNLHKYFKL